MQSTKKLASKAFIILLSVAMFIWIGLKTDWQTTGNAIKNASPLWIGLAVIPMLLAHWLRGARWNMLTEPAGYTLNKRRSFYAVMSGYLVNVATSRGGEIARCALAAKSEKAPVETLVGTVLTERLIDLVVLALMAMLCLVLQFDEMVRFLFLFQPLKTLANSYYQMPLGLKILIIAILAAVLLFAFIFLKKKIVSWINKPQDNQGFISKFANGFKTVFQLESPIKFWLYSILIWCGYWLSGYFSMKALEITADGTLANALGFMMFSALGVIIPLPAGAGVWATMAFGLHFVYGYSENDAQTFGIFSVAYSNTLMIVFGALAYFLYFLEMRKLSKLNS
ncbi:MAG: lysylphosphatidylglycerol synthase transmembrane domain-containing protein [Bacteroidota bacterium]|jgi:uncharacterized protein (TIRG00374 family)